MSLKEEVLEMKKEVQAVREQSLAMEMLKDYKKTNKRLFIIILTMLLMWFATIVYLVYILNDIGYEEVTTESYDVTQDSGDNGNNNFINGKSNEVNN